MKLLVAAVAVIMPLAACSSASVATTSANGASGEAMYCWKDRLMDDSGKLKCNWESSRGEACASASFTTLASDRYSEPKTVSMCPNGQWLVEVHAKG